MACNHRCLSQSGTPPHICSLSSSPLVCTPTSCLPGNPPFYTTRWQPTPVFLPGESQGWVSLVGCHLCGRTESDMTEVTQQQQQQQHVPSVSSPCWFFQIELDFHNNLTFCFYPSPRICHPSTLRDRRYHSSAPSPPVASYRFKEQVKPSQWHHQLNGHEFEHALGAGDGQGGLACCGPWGCEESDMTE